MRNYIQVPCEYHQEMIKQVELMLARNCEIKAMSTYGFVVQESTEEISVLQHPTDGLQIVISYERG